MTVGELLKKADSLELSEWQALYNLRSTEALRSALDAKALAGVNKIKG